MLNLIQSLLKLQALDGRIRSTLKKILRKQEEIDHLLAEQTKDRETIGTLKSAKDRESLDLSGKELDLKNVEEKLASLKQKLYGGDITSSKELSNWEKNMEVFEKTKERLEETIISQMIQVESTQATFHRTEEAISRRTIQSEHHLTRTWQDLASLEAELVELNRERTVVSGEIPDTVFEDYTDLLQFVNDPVAELVGDTCRGCRLSISISIEKTIRKDENLAHCPNCQRFIYPND